MANYILSRQATTDLTEIYYYYAFEKEEPTYADTLQDKLLKRFSWLADNPGIGHWKPSEEKSKSFRFLAVDSYYIVYRESNSGNIEISRIYHQSRNLQNLLLEEKKEQS